MNWLKENWFKIIVAVFLLVVCYLLINITLNGLVVCVTEPKAGLLGLNSCHF